MAVFRLRTLGIVVAVVAALVVSGGLLATLGDSGLGPSGPVSAQAPSTDRVVAVNGEGRVMVMPDTAEVTLGVTITNADLGAAQSEANSKMDAVIAALKDNGVAENQIKTSSYSIQVNRDWEKADQPITGYTIYHLVHAKVKPMDDVGDVIQAAVDAGANTVNDVMFSVENVDGAVRQAREQAMEDARQKAQHLAELGGVTLGPPVVIAEGTTPSPMPKIYDGRETVASDMAGGAAPIQPGETEVYVSVSVSYGIQ